MHFIKQNIFLKKNKIEKKNHWSKFVPSSMKYAFVLMLDLMAYFSSDLQLINNTTGLLKLLPCRPSSYFWTHTFNRGYQCLFQECISLLSWSSLVVVWPIWISHSRKAAYLPTKINVVLWRDLELTSEKKITNTNNKKEKWVSCSLLCKWLSDETFQSRFLSAKNLTAPFIKIKTAIQSP